MKMAGEGERRCDIRWFSGEERRRTIFFNTRFDVLKNKNLNCDMLNLYMSKTKKVEINMIGQE